MSDVNLAVGLGGYFKLVATNVTTGKVRELTGWFKNLITDAGLERIGATAGTREYCMVGSGSIAPSVADTTLQTKVAHSSTKQSDTNGRTSVSPYYAWNRVTYRFATGVAAGNLAEVGVGWTTTAVFSRSLIKDGNGNPTTVTVLSDETLDVLYELRAYAPETDTTFQLVIGGVTHDCVLRACAVTSNIHWASLPNDLAFNLNTAPAQYGYCRAWNGSLGGITTEPGGTSSDATSLIQNVYSNNSRKRTGTLNFGLNAGNLAGGITAITFGGYAAYLGTFKVSFSPAINKLNTQTLALNVEMSWARAA